MRRWASPVVIISILALLVSTTPVVLIGAGTSIVTDPTFLLFRVAPSTPLEFVTIQNVSNRSADALGWSIDDGEGWIRVNVTTILQPGGRLSLSADSLAFKSYYPHELVIGYRDDHVTRHGTFALADKGDQVDLISSGGKIADTFCFGSSTPSAAWSGMPFAPLPKGDMAVRNLAIQDSGTSADWYRSCVGRSEQSLTSFQASVEAFTCPESGQNQMIREISGAQTTIDACVYELGDPVVTKLFTDAEFRGVKVTLLIEGQPVAGLSNESKTAIVSLINAGCDVRRMVSNQSYRRYDCLHAKYFVIDQERVTVMSENWAAGLLSNRGWGVTVTSDELAQAVLDMFREDSSLARRDVTGASSVVSDWYAPPNLVVVPLPGPAASGPMMAGVSLIVSPDTSYQGVLDLISSATTRLLVEQLNIDPAWVGKNQIMEELVNAAERGVQVRVLLDQTFVDTSTTSNNTMTVDALNVLAQSKSLDLEARLVSDYHDLGVLHNKGVIADDQVLVSSINWVDSSVFQNREVGLVIASPSVSSFFADFFWRDWAVDPDPPMISVPWNNLTLIEGEPVVLDARQSRDNAGISSFLWTDGLTGAEWNGSYVLAFLGLGIHQITLKETDRFGNQAMVKILVIVDPPNTADEPNYLLIIPVGAAGLVCCIWAVLKRFKGG